MAITTTPTPGQIAALKQVFVDEFGGGSPPDTESDIGDALANCLAKALELALIEIKDNAKALDGTAGGDALDID